MRMISMMIPMDVDPGWDKSNSLNFYKLHLKSCTIDFCSAVNFWYNLFTIFKNA